MRHDLLMENFPHILHGGDYNPDQWLDAPEVIEEDFRLMKKAGCRVFSIGIFSWTALEPQEGVFTFDWLDRIMDRMAQEGHRVILATPSGSKPAWLAQAHPEICRVDYHGRREPHGARHNHCWSSPAYRQAVQRINRALAARYSHHPALAMWHVSNEYGGACHCPLCIARWQEWLRARYGTLQALNQAWWTAFWNRTYTDWEQIHPSEFSHDGLMLDWMRFTTHQMVDFYQMEVAPLHAANSAIPCTTNFMGLSNGHDYARFARVVDLVADDQYPRYHGDDADLAEKVNAIAFKHDLYRNFKPGRPWMLMESCPDDPQYPGNMAGIKPPGLHHAEMLQALGHGAEGTLYFQWRKGRGGHEKFHGAVVGHDGTGETRVFREVEALGRLYERLTPILGSRTPAAEVGLIYDGEARWAFQFNSTANAGNAYDRIAQSHYRPFRDHGVPVDVFESERDFSSYKLLIAPQLYMLKPGVAARLRAFVEQGGVLVGTVYTGFVGESGLCFTGGFPGDGLREVFGIWNEETDVLLGPRRQRMRLTGGAEFEVEGAAALVHPDAAGVLAVYTESFYAGSPALTVHSLGKGQAYYQAGRSGPEFQNHFYTGLMAELGLRRPLPTPPPMGVQLQERVSDHGRFLFVQNFTGESQTLKLPPGSWHDLGDTGTAIAHGLLAPWQSGVLIQED
jgi:beta-galactosidase